MTELRELILLSLPMHKLFTIRATNKTFQDHIQNTSKLKQKMFLESKPQPLNGQPQPPPMLNPLLYASMLRPGQRDPPDYFKHFWRDRQTLQERRDAYLVANRALRFPPTSLRIDFKPQNQFLCVPRLMEVSETDKDGNWRDMMAVQNVSAADDILIRFGGGKEPGQLFPETKVLLKGNCTFGELYAWVQEQLKGPMY